MVYKEEVGVDIRFLLAFIDLLACSPIGFQSEEVHHAEYALLVDMEVYGESFVPICRMFTKYFFDSHLQLPVFVRKLGTIVHASP